MLTQRLSLPTLEEASAPPDVSSAPEPVECFSEPGQAEGASVSHTEPNEQSDCGQTEAEQPKYLE